MTEGVRLNDFGDDITTFYARSQNFEKRLLAS
jgi:hypothetical protein